MGSREDDPSKKPDSADAPLPAAAPPPVGAMLTPEDEDAVELPGAGAPPPVPVRSDLADSILPPDGGMVEEIDVDEDDVTDHGGTAPPTPGPTDSPADAGDAALPTPDATFPDVGPTLATGAAAAAAEGSAPPEPAAGGAPPPPEAAAKKPAKKKKGRMGCVIGAIVAALLLLGIGVVAIAGVAIVGLMLFGGLSYFALDSEPPPLEIDIIDEVGIVDEPEGDATEGDATEGDATEGDATEGDATEGDATEGDATEGDATEGDASEGDAVQITPGSDETGTTAGDSTTVGGSNRSATTSDGTSDGGNRTSTGPVVTTDGGKVEVDTKKAADQVRTAVSPQKSKVTVTGDAKVVLVKGRSRYPVPGNVPAGKYDIEASFGGGDAVVVGTVKVEAGQPTAIACNDRMEICRAR